MSVCRILLVFILLIFILLNLVLPLQAATPAEYDRALARVQNALQSQEQAVKVSEIPVGEAPALIAQRELGKINSLEVPNMAPQTVDTSRLIASIRAASALHNPQQQIAASEAVYRQIGLLRSELSQSKGTLPSTDTIEASVRKVLGQPEFASDPIPPQTLAERFAAWLSKQLDKLQGPKYNGPTPSVNPKLILGILIAVAVAAFAVLVFVLVQALGRRGAKSAPLALDEAEAALVDARDNNSLLGLAEQHAKNGDYRRAFRLVYLAALVALDTDGILRFNKSKTNWEYLRALRGAGRSDVTQAMTPLTRDFDRVWYGFGKADSVDYANALAQYHALQSVPTGSAR